MLVCVNESLAPFFSKTKYFFQAQTDALTYISTVEFLRGKNGFFRYNERFLEKRERERERQRQKTLSC